jgi:hypothetical protein
MMQKILGYISGVSVLPILYFAFRWFLRTTDVMVAYNWSWQGMDFYPNFDLRNYSSSKAYVLGNIAYTRNNGKEIVTFDNKSLWGLELKPGTTTHLSSAPVLTLNSLADCLKVEVTVRLQNGREFKGQGPGQPYTGFRKHAFALRQKIERSSVPLPS